MSACLADDRLSLRDGTVYLETDTMADESSMNSSDILLDAGTNEVEVLVFQLETGWFGVNVAKVREVIKPVELIIAPKQHASVLGMFNIRGVVLPIVDLARHLDFCENGDIENGRVIITEFNGLCCGFLVNAVDQIHRVGWDRIKPAPDVNAVGGEDGKPATATITGTLELDGRIVLLIDFESIADEILTEKRLHIDHVDNPDGVDRASKRIILAEDSPFMRTRIGEVLYNSGYAGAELYPDGEAAWDAIVGEGRPIDAIISDIEMPRLDGLTLTKRIRDESVHEGVPIVLFSSLISADNKKKGQQVGATAQIPKPALHQLVRLIDKAVLGELNEATIEEICGATAAA